MIKIKINSATITSATFLLLILFFASCDKSRIYEENQTIPEDVWSKDNVLKFDVNVIDTISSNNFYVNVRNADGYPYNNLFIFIKTTFPNGKVSDDTLECVLADEKGEWLGSGMGDIYDNQIPFKKNVRFPIAGKYMFEIQQAMRIDKIPLIMDIGLRIEKAK